MGGASLAAAAGVAESGGEATGDADRAADRGRTAHEGGGGGGGGGLWPGRDLASGHRCPPCSMAPVCSTQTAVPHRVKEELSQGGYMLVPRFRHLLWGGGGGGVGGGVEGAHVPPRRLGGPQGLMLPTSILTATLRPFGFRRPGGGGGGREGIGGRREAALALLSSCGSAAGSVTPAWLQLPNLRGPRRWSRRDGLHQRGQECDVVAAR